MGKNNCSKQEIIRFVGARQKKMSLAIIVVLVLACLGAVWYLTRSEPERTPYKKEAKPKETKSKETNEIKLHQTPEPRAPVPLLVYDMVTETNEACEHVIWFSRCEGDVYEAFINNVPVAKGSGPYLDVAHLKNHSSMALMTNEKIAFPLELGINVYRDGQLFGRGVCTVRGTGEPLPEA